MNYIVYKSVVTRIGDYAEEFLSQGLIIMFNNDVPKDLADISVLHTVAEFIQDIKVGDTVMLGGNKYAVTYVGSDANRTLKAMGHCTFRFNGNNADKLPGQIELDGETPAVIEIGSAFEIIYNVR